MIKRIFQDLSWKLIIEAIRVYIFPVLVLIGLGVIAFLVKVDAQTLLLVLLLVGELAIIWVLYFVWKRTEKPKTSNDILFQDPNTKNVYLIDRHGLFHRIESDRTILYFAEMLGYQVDDLPQLSPDKSTRGSNIEEMLFWRPPSMPEEEEKRELRRDTEKSLQWLQRDARIENERTVLWFRYRYIGEKPLQINSANLWLKKGKIVEHDLSPQNRPKPYGSDWLICPLLFEGISESKKVLSLEEFTLELILTRPLTPPESNRLTTANIGQIRFAVTVENKQIDVINNLD